MKSTSTILLALGLAFTTGAAMAQDKMSSMAGMGSDTKPQAGAKATHPARATVTKMDRKAGVVTLAHEPIPSLNWPAMTMGFKVKDKSLATKLREGQQVQVEIAKQGDDYVITSVK